MVSKGLVFQSCINTHITIPQFPWKYLILNLYKLYIEAGNKKTNNV